MPTFVVLGRYTDEGRASIKDSPARLDQARKVLRKLGGDITDFYLTIGPHDFVAVVQAPNDDLVAKFILAVGAQGYVRTTTLKAYPEAEYRRLIAGDGSDESPHGQGPLRPRSVAAAERAGYFSVTCRGRTTTRSLTRTDSAPVCPRPSLGMPRGRYGRPPGEASALGRLPRARRGSWPPGQIQVGG